MNRELFHSASAALITVQYCSRGVHFQVLDPSLYPHIQIPLSAWLAGFSAIATPLPQEAQGLHNRHPCGLLLHPGLQRSSFPKQEGPFERVKERHNDDKDYRLQC